MARQKKIVSENYASKLEALCTKVLEEWEKAPNSFSECTVQKVTVERWNKGENFPNHRTFESFLQFLRLTQRQWEEFEYNKIDFETFWNSRGKSKEARIITMDTCLNDIRTLSFEEKIRIIREITNMLITSETVNQANFVILMPSQLKRLKTWLIYDRITRKDKDTTTFKGVINKGVNESLINSIVEQKTMEFNKEEFDKLAIVLLKPIKWIDDEIVILDANQSINSFDELMKELNG
jgi:hypothetical protein